MTKTIALYGNLIYDTIYVVDSFHIGFGEVNLHPEIKEVIRQYGGIGNVERDLQCLHKYETTGHFCIGSEATIFCEPNEKTSFVYWGPDRLTYNPFPLKADWHHIAYLDALPSITIEALDSLSGVISADLCKSYHDADRIIELAKHVDYLLMSDQEINRLFPFTHGSRYQYVNLARRATIIHSPEGFHQVSADGTIMKYNVKRKNITRPVVGAGDRFAAYFIDGMLDGKHINAACMDAYNKTTESLL